MKKLLFLLLPVVGFAQTNKDETVTIMGNVTGNTKGYNNIYFYSAGVKSDSAAIIDGQFKITVPFKDVYIQLVYTQYEAKTKGGYRPFPILIDQPGTITIADMDIEEGFSSAKLGGEPTAVTFQSFSTQQRDAYVKLNKLVRHYMESIKLTESVDHYRDSMGKQLLTPIIIDFVKQNPNSFASAYVLGGTARSYLDVKQMEKAFSYLSPEMKKSAEGKKVSAYIEGMNNAGVGNQAKAFVLNDPEGRPVSFEQYKGKYVWVDFWASWCVPCKKAFPHMNEIYTKYKGDKFEIVGISADATKDPWLKAVNEIKNPWPQLWDNKAVTDAFAVKAFPTSFLIDPNGKIILREEGFEPNGALEKKLDELFGKTKY